MSSRDGRNESPTDALLVRVSIKDINHTTDIERIALGTLARSNEVIAEVSLIDEKLQTLLSAFRLKGVSPERTGIRIDWPWGSVDQALRRIIHELVRQLADWSRME